MQRLELDCEELLNWWEPKSDISYIFRFNWRSLQQLREAVTSISAQMMSAESELSKGILEDKRFAEHLMAELNETLGFHPSGEQVDARPPINQSGTSSGVNNPALPA